MPERIEGLTRVAAEISGCGWVPRRYTTDPPRYVWHTEWDWKCHLEAERPVFLVAMLEWGPVLRHGRGRWCSVDTRFDLTLSFHLDRHTDEVRVGIYGTGMVVESAALKEDPRPRVQMHVSDGTRFA